MNPIINLIVPFLAEQEKMNEEFKRRAELNIKEYWDACKYPRKLKKKIRKQAEEDYHFNMLLSKDIW